MLNGIKATLLPNEAKDTVSAFSTFVQEREEYFYDLLCDYRDRIEDVYSFDFTDELPADDWRKIAHDQLEEQHFADVRDGLYDYPGERTDTGKVLDHYGERELCDPDDTEDNDWTDEEYFELAELHGHL
jgi:hypothetical protein